MGFEPVWQVFLTAAALDVIDGNFLVSATALTFHGRLYQTHESDSQKYLRLFDQGSIKIAFLQRKFSFLPQRSVGFKPELIKARFP